MTKEISMTEYTNWLEINVRPEAFNMEGYTNRKKTDGPHHCGTVASASGYAPAIIPGLKYTPDEHRPFVLSDGIMEYPAPWYFLAVYWKLTLPEQMYLFYPMDNNGKLRKGPHDLRNAIFRLRFLDEERTRLGGPLNFDLSTLPIGPQAT